MSPLTEARVVARDNGSGVARAEIAWGAGGGGAFGDVVSADLTRGAVAIGDDGAVPGVSPK
ncbi:hypothetical protein [Streptomyces buecherae]|uniref:hypothetical protein n=1 Tax=Streptomyces buecherae TaxID=2763006 RepID=UPI0037884009